MSASGVGVVVVEAWGEVKVYLEEPLFERSCPRIAATGGCYLDL